MYIEIRIWRILIKFGTGITEKEDEDPIPETPKAGFQPND